jgi:L-2-hydroxyglutarate oxidase LhgO
LNSRRGLDVAIAGGGIVGLAIARELSRAGREVVVLEAESQLGQHTSSRNSEVIHAGIYYAAGSLKAWLCVRGNELLYGYCEREGVPHRRIGKLVLATRDEEIAELDLLFTQAAANGVHDLVWLDAADVRALEPSVVAVRGLFSPSTGIVDSSLLLAALKREALAAGTTIVTSTPVLGGRAETGRLELSLGGPDGGSFGCAAFINAAGLGAPSLSRAFSGLDPSAIPPAHFAKGHYFALAARSPFRHLIYPVPVAGGLGIHLTLDLAGRARFGPDVSYVDSVDYAFDTARAAQFVSAVRTYYPALTPDLLVPGYTGIRPKLGPPGTSHDFLIQGPAATGARGYFALYGIESPGLTASLAIAEHVRRLFDRSESEL